MTTKAKWLPIKTAPDKAKVLAYSKKFGICIAHRSDDVWSRDLSWAAHDGSVGAFYLDTRRSAGLTHWMPLPEPPK